MILNGNQRAGGLKLAAHLTNTKDNDHVEIHELRGFSADDLRGAFQEVEAIAKGTKCQQFLFSLSINPPEMEDVNIADIEAAIERAEEQLGLTGQSRAIVFHEKEGRRHAHAVWSRIDVAEMKAINLPHYKRKLKTLSKELFLEHGWRLPDGFRDRENRNPLNFSLAEWQQAKRSKQDPKRLKLMFQECWAVSDNAAAFKQALEEKGYHLAKGDRRGFVAIDVHGEVYSLSRWISQKNRALTEKLGKASLLKTVQATKDDIAARMTDKLRGFVSQAQAQSDAQLEKITSAKTKLKDEQRQRREVLRQKLEQRQQQEVKLRAGRFRKGVRGLWDWVSGQNRKIRKRNEQEAAIAAKRDALERQSQIARQLQERRVLQRDLREMKRDADQKIETLHQDLAHYMGFRDSGSSDVPPAPRHPLSHAQDHSPTR